MNTSVTIHAFHCKL